MKHLKFLCGLLCLLLLASNVWSMSRWNEARGVFDDVCYLRQAHLFQRFGISGLDTDVSRDDDHYLTMKLTEIGYPTADDMTTAPCHTMMPSGERVLQYPPGTGFVLALFPEGHQVIPLYVLASIVLFGFAALAIILARTVGSVVLAGTFGCLAMYLMINPSKASYSMAPTMMVCALAGWLTARVFGDTEPVRLPWLTIALGLLLGVSVNFRLPNLLLGAGYFLYLLVALLWTRKIAFAGQVVLLGAAFLVGLAPTLVANAVNAGSPLATTYGARDVTPPHLAFSVIRQYAADQQSVLLLLAVASAVWLSRPGGEVGTRRIALVVGLNLLLNVAFFMSHTVVTPYYTVPIAMLSLWTLLFASLMPAPGRETRLAS